MARIGKHIAVSLDAWIVDEVLKNSKNRSARIQELITKGLLFEQRQKLLKAPGNPQTSPNPQDSDTTWVKHSLGRSSFLAPVFDFTGIP